MDKITHFSLFTGIGGIDLAAEWAGFETVGQCEFADYPTKVLEKHWPDVPRWRDIRSVTKESIESKGIKNITLVSGGFPCQPFSVAGRRRGKEDDRYLWPEMCRVISEIKPAWIIGENVPGIINMELDKVISDLEGLSYSCQTFNIPACAVDANHRRSRIFIVGYSERCGLSREPRRRSRTEFEDGYLELEKWIMADDGGQSKKFISTNDQNAKQWSKCGTEFSGGRKNVPDPAGDGCGSRWPESERQSGESGAFGGGGNVPNSGYSSGASWGSKLQRGAQEEGEGQTIGTEGFSCDSRGARWSIEPELGRVANGISNRVDRLKCLGNAVVPQQVYPILKAIADIENGEV